jgi:hypothetical protein
MPYTLKQFRKDHPELKGKRVILCEHLKNKSIDDVDVNLWIGDNTRLLLCTICQKIHSQTIWMHMIKSVLLIVGAARSIEYKSWLEEAGKEK